MIDAVMYGMMPSANTAICRRLPPVNVLTNPRKAALGHLHELEQARADRRPARDVQPMR